MMSWEVGIIAGATILAPIVVFLIKRRLDSHRWKRMRSNDIPMWLVVKAYEQWYSHRDNLPRKDLIIPGAYYIYNVRSKDKDMKEVRARVNNMIVYQKEPDDKK